MSESVIEFKINASPSVPPGMVLDKLPQILPLKISKLVF